MLRQSYAQFCSRPLELRSDARKHTADTPRIRRGLNIDTLATGVLASLTHRWSSSLAIWDASNISPWIGEFPHVYISELLVASKLPACIVIEVIMYSLDLSQRITVRGIACEL